MGLFNDPMVLAGVTLLTLGYGNKVATMVIGAVLLILGLVL